MNIKSQRLARLLGLLALVLAGCRPGTEVSDDVELVTNFEDLGPAASFELRFDRPIASPDQLGVSSTNSPLVFAPPVPGSFIWLSQRSGTFTPAKPLAMDTRYELALAGGLRDAQGQPVKATLRRILRTPPFSLTGFLPTRASTNAGSEPEVMLVFNAEVQAADGSQFIEFLDAYGRRVAAKVRQGTLDELPANYEFGDAVTLRTWNQRCQDRQPKRTSKSSASEEGEDSGTNAVPNFLIASPQAPLPISRGWRLVIDPGLRAAEGGLRLRQRGAVPIGDVTPFTVLGAIPRNVVNRLPAVAVEFSKAPAQSLTNGWFAWIDMAPSPTNLTAELRGTTLLLQGSFKSQTDYTLTLRSGLPAAEAFRLKESKVLKVTIPPVDPRLYFPAFATEQLANGNRTFQLLAVNVPEVRLRAKLVEPQAAIHALRGYGGYFRDWRDREAAEEPYRRLDYNLLPGRTVFNEEIPGTSQTDVATNLTLNWDKLLSGRRAAVVFLEAERVREDPGGEDRLGTQALIQLTDLAVLWKDAPSQVEAFVFSHRTGQPVSGAAVKLVTEENELLQEATTAANGTSLMPAATNAHWLTVQLGEDFHAVEVQEQKIPLYSFHLPTADLSESDDSRRVLLFSDRELYRPGETVHLKAIARDWAEGGLTIPTALTGTLVCSDSRGREFFQTNVDFSAFGSCAAAVPLICESRGFYRFVLRLGKHEYDYSFQVQDFQPSAFEIALEAKSAYQPGEKIQVPVSARYYFGKPLSRARLKWSLEAQDTDFSPHSVEGFAFARSSSESRFGRGASSVTLTGEESLASATNSVITPEVPLNAAAPHPRSCSLRVEVTDICQQTLSRRAEFIQHSSEFYLGLKQVGEVQSVGKEAPLEIVAVGTDGKPWPRAVTVQARLRRLDWRPVRVQGAGRSMRFRNEVVFTNIAERAVEVLPAQLPRKEREAVTGTPIPGMIPPQAGQYIIEASTADTDGRPVISSLEFTVAAHENLAWDYRNDVQMVLRPDRALYAPGETAQILVEAPISGVALVTVEREKVLRSFTTMLEGNAPLIQVPIEPADVPNVFVSVTLVRGSEACPRTVKEPEYRVGYCQITVEDSQRRLAVNVTSPSTNYLPAQPVTLRVAVKDSRGAGVGDAEVTLYAVDEGILSLSGSEVPDPYAFFYAPRPLAVASGISLPDLLTEDPGELRFGNKGYLGGGGGSDRLRRNFQACAFWNASLRTDAAGQVQAVFPAPDSLTRYRIIAVAHTLESQFGTGQTAFQVSKPLVVEPALPRFANVTDLLQARAVVHNQTSQPGEVEITLEPDDHVRLGGARAAKVLVPAHGSVSVEFPLEFVEAGVAKWTWKTRFTDESQGGFTDAVQSVLNVDYPAPLLREVRLAKARGTEVDLLAQANPQLVTGQGTVSVELANTRLIGLSESVAGLLHYPYGCAEQTGSSLLPWVALRDLGDWLPFLHRGTNEPERAVRAGVARLFSMQTESGGLGYWPKDREPMFWASAYGGLVLALAQRHGVQLPKEDFNRLLNYLSTQLRSDTSPSPPADHLCLAAYTLAVAGRAEAAYHEKLFGQRAQLSPEGHALLALAIGESQGPREMANELLAPKAAARGLPEDPFDCPGRQKAIWLLACVSVRPDEARLDTLVRDLMNEQREGQWQTTQGNAWSILALSEYGRRVEGTLEPCAGELRWGQESVPFRLEGTNNVFTRTFPLGHGAAGPALTLVSAKGTVFASTTIAARPHLIQQPDRDLGFRLQRRYHRLNDDGEVRVIRDLRVGDRVVVTLELDVREPARFLVLDDALPSNLEAVNPDFRAPRLDLMTASPIETRLPLNRDHQEIRADRVLFFCNDVEPGNYGLHYLARVRAAATAIAPSAKVEEMYHPDRCGLTRTEVLSSQPME